jgi:hypothetical protein
MKLLERSKTAVLSTGIAARGTIVRIREGGPIVNDRPTIELELDVELPSSPPYRATARGRLPRVLHGRLALGETIPVRVSTGDRSRVVVDEHALLGTPADEVGYRVKAKPGALTMADVIARGEPATLRLRKVSNPGMRTPDGRDPVLVLHVEVEIPGRKPYRARVGQRTPETPLTHVVSGAELPGRVLPDNRRHVAVDWVAAGLASPDWVGHTSRS